MLGRIRQKQIDSIEAVSVSPNPIICPICEREIPPAQMDAHHLIPRKADLRIQFTAAIPRERILVETDAPALCPAPEFRMRELAPDAAGAEQNHPSNLVRNNAELARTMGVTPEESAALTSANFARLFGA